LRSPNSARRPRSSNRRSPRPSKTASPAWRACGIFPPRSPNGLSLTTIQFALETNTDRALNDVKDAVTRVRANLPQNVNEPLIQRVDVIGLPIVTYAAISPGKTPEQLFLLRRRRRQARAAGRAQRPLRSSASAVSSARYWSRSILIGCRPPA